MKKSIELNPIDHLYPDEEDNNDQNIIDDHCGEQKNSIIQL